MARPRRDGGQSSRTVQLRRGGHLGQEVVESGIPFGKPQLRDGHLHGMVPPRIEG